MLSSPSIVLWLLTAGGVLVVALARFRPLLARRAAAALTSLTLPVWLLLMARLPIVTPVYEWPSVTGLPPLNWHIDQLAWQLTGVLLVLAAAVLLFELRSESDDRLRAGEAHLHIPLPALVMLLSAAGLATLWADSIAGLLNGWMLLILVWFWMLSQDEPIPGTTRRLLILKSGWLSLSIFFLWLAAANLPAAVRPDFDMADWPRVASSSTLSAALMQMGIWPFHGWRPSMAGRSSASGVMLHVVPTLSGASLLARLMLSSEISAGYSLFLTAFGLIGLLVAVYRSWASAHPGTAAALALASLALLAGVWSGYEALAAETRVMVLATGVFFLIPAFLSDRTLWWRLAAGIGALAAVSGLPLTAGFAGRSALFHALLANARWLMALIVGLLIALLAGTITSQVSRKPDSEEPGTALPTTFPTLGHIAEIISLTLLFVSLLSLSGSVQERMNPESWIFIVMSPIAILVAVRRSSAWRDVGSVLKRAFSLKSTTQSIRAIFQTLSRQLMAALRDTAEMLESDGGLLWMLVLITVLLLVR